MLDFLLAKHRYAAPIRIYRFTAEQYWMAMCERSNVQMVDFRNPEYSNLCAYLY
jgi:hypothetical protein